MKSILHKSKSNRFFIKKICFLALLFIAFCGLSSAQQKCAETETNLHQERYTDYTNVPFSIDKVRLDYAAKALKLFPKKTVYLIISGKSFGRKSVATQRLKKAEQYLLKTHHIEKKRIVTFNGTIRNWLELKIYVLDKNQKEQPCNEQAIF